MQIDVYSSSIHPWLTSQTNGDFELAMLELGPAGVLHAKTVLTLGVSHVNRALLDGVVLFEKCTHHAIM